MKEKISTTKILILILFITLISFLLWQFYVGKTDQSLTNTKLQIQDHQLVRARLGSKDLSLEVVNTAASITQGLSDRQSIGADGMIFIFPQAKKQTFWMKQMKFNLDMIWLNHGQVIDITLDVPAPKSDISDRQLPIYSPKSEADMVLEIDAGKAKEWNIKIGDKLQFAQ